MLRLILLRLLSAVPVLAAALIVSFVLFQVIPGDAAVVALGDRASPAELAAERHALGLDQPPLVRFARFGGQLLRGDLGRSLLSGRPVVDEVADRLPYTLELTLSAVVGALILGVAVGAIAAARAGSVLDLAINSLSAALLAAPVFALALALTWLFALRWQVFPVAGAGSWRHLILPATTLALPSFASFTRLGRAAFREAMTADYVRTGRAKGLPPVVLYWRHIWPNAAAPVLAFFGVHLGSLLGGAVVVEAIFGWPGLGRLAVQAILTRDLPLAQGALLVLAAGFVVANAIADVAHYAVDPRAR